MRFSAGPGRFERGSSSGSSWPECSRCSRPNVTRLRELVEKIIEGLPAGRDCPCPDALDGIKLLFELPG